MKIINKDKQEQSEYNKKYYIDNKDKCILRSKDSYKTRKDKYHKDNSWNLYENVKASRFAFEKRKKSEEFKEREIEITKENTNYNQMLSVDAGAIKNRKWTDGEIKYLQDNYKDKTHLEMALELNRTLFSLKSALIRFNIGRKNRDLKKFYKLSRKEIIIKARLSQQTLL